MNYLQQAALVAGALWTLAFVIEHVARNADPALREAALIVWAIATGALVTIGVIGLAG